MQSDVGAVGAVKVQQLAQVRPGQHVTVEHHDGVVAQVVGDVGDAAAGAQRLFLGDVVDLQAQLGTVAELGLEDLRLVRRAQHDVFDARRGDPRQQVGEERQPGGRQHRLGRRQRQRPQPGALAADQDHCINVGISHLRAALLPMSVDGNCDAHCAP
jgi:hypothetical protein